MPLEWTNWSKNKGGDLTKKSLIFFLLLASLAPALSGQQRNIASLLGYREKISFNKKGARATTDARAIKSISSPYLMNLVIGR